MYNVALYKYLYIELSFLFGYRWSAHWRVDSLLVYYISMSSNFYDFPVWNADDSTIHELCITYFSPSVYFSAAVENYEIAETLHIPIINAKPRNIKSPFPITGLLNTRPNLTESARKTKRLSYQPCTSDILDDIASSQWVSTTDQTNTELNSLYDGRITGRKAVNYGDLLLGQTHCHTPLQDSSC